MVFGIFLALGVAVAVNMLMFLVSFWLKRDFLIDVTYALTFVVTLVIVMVVGNKQGLNQYLVLGLITIWATRLGGFLLVRIHEQKHDQRFDKFRNSFWKFGAFWLLQAFSAWVINIPAYLAATNLNLEASVWTFLFCGLALFFIAFETVADLQKYLFNQRHKGEFINVGLWKISRHPNYFGEIGFWFALALTVVFSGFRPVNLVAVISPVWIGFLLCKVSGVPILEKRGLQRFGSNPDYLAYLNKTPCLVPFIGQRGYKKFRT